MRFLLIEDNEELGDAVFRRFDLDGHAVDWARTIAEADEFLAVEDYDLVILDIMLPDGDGRHLLARRREARSETPIVVLTARSQVSDRVGVLDLGADDYITKPFHFDELEARCRAVLRRRRGAAQNSVTIGRLEFDPVRALVLVDGKAVELRNREVRLLEIFVSGPGRVFSKTHLLDRLFALDEDATENAIEVYVGRLRRKIEGSGVRIETERGLGYRLKVD